MSTTYTTEVLRHVYDDSRGAFIEVRPGTDGFGIEVATTDGISAEYFGAFRFCIPKEMAEKLGQALLDAAKEVE